MAPDVELPIALNTPEMREALAGYEDMRIHIKKPLTPYAMKLAIDKISAWGHAVAVEALNNSTLGDWQGLFDPREARNGSQAPKTKEPTVWEIKSILEPLKEEAKDLRHRRCAEGPLSVEWDTPADKKEWHALRQKINALEGKLKDKASKIL